MRLSTTTTLVGTLALAVLSTATPSGDDETTVYRIADFTTRKHDGVNVDSVYFNIQATNDGSLDFTCTAFDPAINNTTEHFENGFGYSCGAHSLFSWSYDVVDTLLSLWQQVAPAQVSTLFLIFPFGKEGTIRGVKSA